MYVVAGLLLVLAGARWVRASSASSGVSPSSSATRSGGAPAGVGLRVDRADGGVLVVYVAGAVRRPGVYRLRTGARVDAAVRRAGGPTRHADLEALNLAAKLEDGRQVVVPRRPAAGALASAGEASSGGGAAAPVNLNTASAEQLATLDGVGPAMAAKIVAYRQEHGGFRSVDELDAVSGIGPKRLAALRDHVTT